MSTFHEKRQALFERAARRGKLKLDPQAWLIPTHGRSHPVGPHSLSTGWAIRASAELTTALAEAGDTSTAWHVLDQVLNYQDTRPESFSYGNFLWYSGWDRALDPNAVSFIAPHLAHLYKHHRQDMPDALRDRLESALRLAVTGLNTHRATWGYTNIALLNIAGKVMIGDCLGDPRARDIAFWDWEEWRNHTARLGMVTEYNSVCYTFVQIHALAMMLTCDVDPAFLTEVRSVLRHLLSAMLLDFHPAVGRITGPQSRAYENDRRRRLRSGMQTVLHLVWDEPLPDDTGQAWLGAPIGPDDVLFDRNALPLPRTTRAHTHGFTRLNHLAKDFALGSVSGRASWIGHGTPFFLAYRSESERCTIPIQPTAHRVDAHHACQRDGALLGACVWLIDRTAGADSEQTGWAGKLTGLNTGRPDTLEHDPQAAPGFRLELGLPDQITLANHRAETVTDLSGPLPGSALSIETESVRVFLRFVGADPAAPALSLSQEPDGEIVLTVSTGRAGTPINDREAAAMGAFFLHVVPRDPTQALSQFAALYAGLALHAEANGQGWRVRTDGTQVGPMDLHVPVDPPTFYSTGTQSVTANQWAMSLSEGTAR